MQLRTGSDPETSDAIGVSATGIGLPADIQYRFGNVTPANFNPVLNATRRVGAGPAGCGRAGEGGGGPITHSPPPSSHTGQRHSLPAPPADPPCARVWGALDCRGGSNLTSPLDPSQPLPLNQDERFINWMRTAPLPQ